MKHCFQVSATGSNQQKPDPTRSVRVFGNIFQFFANNSRIFSLCF